MFYFVSELVVYDVFELFSGKYWLGIDYLGCDVLSCLLDGVCFIIFIFLVVVGFVCVIGIFIVLFVVVSYWCIDEIISCFMDVLIFIFSKIFVLVMIVVFGLFVLILFMIIVISYMFGLFCLVCLLVVNVVNMDFVMVVCICGESCVYLVVKEILFNIVYFMLVDFGLWFVFVVLLLSSLSFFGLGVQLFQVDLGLLV